MIGDERLAVCGINAEFILNGGCNGGRSCRMWCIANAISARTSPIPVSPSALKFLRPEI
ncbi:MAG: hypothetical protein QNK40_16320 [Desulfobacterales bacterium]|nr:hypothetical protein [Desulfobacterales bacterium]MDX2510380.1 hypothetical protein [Desulfobacterales bacterium]